MLLSQQYLSCLQVKDVTQSYLSEQDLFGEQQLDTTLQVLTSMHSFLSQCAAVLLHLLCPAEVFSAMVSRAYSTSREAAQIAAKAGGCSIGSQGRKVKPMQTASHWFLLGRFGCGACGIELSHKSMEPM